MHTLIALIITVVQIHGHSVLTQSCVKIVLTTKQGVVQWLHRLSQEKNLNSQGTEYCDSYPGIAVFRPQNLPWEVGTRPRVGKWPYPRGHVNRTNPHCIYPFPRPCVFQLPATEYFDFHPGITIFPAPEFANLHCVYRFPRPCVF